MRRRQGRDPAIYRMREQSDHNPKQTHYFGVCVCVCMSVGFYFTLIFFYRRIPRAHFLFFVFFSLLQLFPFFHHFILKSNSLSCFWGCSGLAVFFFNAIASDVVVFG